MVGWHYPVNGHKFEQAPELGDGQGGLVCSSPWGHKESDVTEVTKVSLGLYEISRDSCAILKTPKRGQQTPGVQLSIVERPGMRGQEGSRTSKKCHRPRRYPPHLHFIPRNAHFCSCRITLFPRPGTILYILNMAKVSGLQTWL